MAQNFFEKTLKLEAEAIAEMKKNKLVIHTVPEASVANWKSVSAKGMDALIGKAFSKEIYDKLQQLLKEYKEKTPHGGE